MFFVGNNVTVSGTVKNVDTAWKEFDTKNNTGHFVPVVLPESLVGQKVTLSGRTDGDKEITVDPDRLLIVRVENLSNGKVLTIKQGKKVLMTFDFSGATLAGPA